MNALNKMSRHWSTTRFLTKKQLLFVVLCLLILSAIIVPKVQANDGINKTPSPSGECLFNQLGGLQVTPDYVYRTVQARVSHNDQVFGQTYQTICSLTGANTLDYTYGTQAMRANQI